MASLAILGCNRRLPDGVRHPIVDSLASKGAVKIEILVSDREEPSPAPDTRRVDAWQRLVVFGKAEGTVDEVLGKVADALMIGDRILILDSRANRVRVYDRGGNLLQSIGGPGKGPGEFSIPRAMTADPSERIYVADEDRRIQRFRRAAGGWVYDTTLATQFFPADACFSGADLFVLGVFPGKSEVIHRLTQDGRPIGSFAIPYRTDEPTVRYLLNDGALACGEDGVYLALKYLPEVHRYSKDGELVWVARLERYEPLLVLQAPDGSVISGMDPDRGAVHELLSFVPFDSASLLLQLALQDRTSRQERRPYAAVETYVLSRQSGSGSYLGTGWPQVVAGGSGFLAYSEEPYPHAWLFSYR